MTGIFLLALATTGTNWNTHGDLAVCVCIMCVPYSSHTVEEVEED